MVKLFKQTEVELTLVEGHTILASEFDKYADGGCNLNCVKACS